jgi:hypothetical protein
MGNGATAYHLDRHNPTAKLSSKWRRFLIQLRSWEYWPVYIFNIPVVFIWLWNAIRTRDLFFFTLTNPGIETGGFFGESKSQILRHIPDHYKPKTILWEAPVLEEEIEDLWNKSGLSFPVILKPEIGERGWLISRIDSIAELKDYIKKHPIDLILQPFVEMPMELSIMVYSLPDGSRSQVTSICQKDFLHITGDGHSTVEQLILSNDRAFLQYPTLEKKFESQFSNILKAGEKMLLEPIGNHCRGTKFINRNNEIDDSISKVMVGLLNEMPDVHYGRFDMKVSSWEELREGKGIQVLEFNGASSDPAHIYDPGYSLVKAYRDIYFHWSVMARIALQNRNTGKKPVTFKKILSGLIIYFRYKRTNN